MRQHVSADKGDLILMCVKVGNVHLSTFQGDDFSLIIGEYDEAGSKYAFTCSCRMQEPSCKFFPSIWRINQNEDNASARAPMS